MKNVEIKSSLPDRPRVEAALESMGADPVWTRRQKDTFFHVRSDTDHATAWLKLREEEGAVSHLIAYARATKDGEPRPSDYDIAPVSDAAEMAHVLGRSNGVRGVVEKERALWLWKHTRIHLDRVEGLGDFLELEAVAQDIDLEEAHAEAEAMIEGLGLEREHFLSVPYLELLEAKRPD